MTNETRFSTMPTERTDISLRWSHGLSGKRLIDAVLFNHVSSPRVFTRRIDHEIEHAFTWFVGQS
jgi:hypothetical protein